MIKNIYIYIPGHIQRGRIHVAHKQWLHVGGRYTGYIVQFFQLCYVSEIFLNKGVGKKKKVLVKQAVKIIEANNDIVSLLEN